jgi:hypothetical protein
MQLIKIKQDKNGYYYCRCPNCKTLMHAKLISGYAGFLCLSCFGTIKLSKGWYKK